MTAPGASEYGEAWAPIYDQLHPSLPPDDPMILALVDLAHGAPVLELGIGTGRTALPLLAHGLAVTGIDASPKMAERLRAKPGGPDIEMLVQSFEHFELDNRFGLTFLGSNTVFALPSTSAVASCFAAVSRSLIPGGCFVVEHFIIDDARVATGSRTDHRTRNGVNMVERHRIDADSRVASSTYTVMLDGTTYALPVRIRVSSGDELDAAARVVELRLETQWSDWQGTAFDAEKSANRIAIFRKP